jgi:hypothetical protein
MAYDTNNAGRSQVAMINGEILTKVTGNVSEEVPEAAYRLAARQLSRALRARLNKKIIDPDNKELNEFSKGQIGQLILSEPVFNFALSFVLELVPWPMLQDQRRFLAYQLRVQAYEELGEELLEIVGLINGEIKTALEHARGIVPPGDLSPPEKSQTEERATA